MTNLRLLVSVLVFKGTDHILGLFRDFPHQLTKSAAEINLNVTFVVRFNNPNLNSAAFRQQVEDVRIFSPGTDFKIYEEDYNVGFGPGHNANFTTRESDYFLVLNDDIGFPHTAWLRETFERFEKNPKIAAIGDIGNPRVISGLFGNGKHDSGSTLNTLWYAEASVLFLRSSAFREIGMFSPMIEWAMTEDADLSLRLQQHGYSIDWQPIPHEHWRSSSFNSISASAKTSILEHNRANLFAQWGYALHSGNPGTFSAYDVYSEGIGDVLCGLAHLACYAEAQTPESRQHIVVNTSSPFLARMLLPSEVKIASVSTISDLESQYSGRLSNVRSLRNLNYSSPFNIHSLCTAELNIPLASASQIYAIWAKAIGNISRDQSSTQPQLGSDYCVLHLESFRAGHDGRMISDDSINTIVTAVKNIYSDIVFIGQKPRSNDFDIENCDTNVVDLRGKTTLEELLVVVSRAKAFVGVDSFPAHVAQFAGVDSAIVFGSVHPGMRVLSRSKVWPITEDLPCIGCYHTHVEPSVPYCMRRDVACMEMTSSNSITEQLRRMKNGIPHDWDSLDHRKEELQWKYLRLLRFHPAGDRHFNGRQRLPNESITEGLYQIISQLTTLVTPVMRDAAYERLKEDLVVSNRLLQTTNAELRATKATKSSNLHASKNAFIKSSFIHAEGCTVEWGIEAAAKVESTNDDPKLFFAYANTTLLAGTASIVIVASGAPGDKAQLFWTKQQGDFNETDSVISIYGLGPTLLTAQCALDVGDILYIRLDPLVSYGSSEFSGIIKWR